MERASGTAPDAAHRMGLVEALRAFEAGALTPRDYVQACYRQALRVEGDIHAFTVLPEPGDDIASGKPLSGIPVAVKDLYDTRDMETAYGTPIFAGHRPARDAALVAALKQLGASILGKTVTTEFAWKQAGPTRNPASLAHSPGGSSSGSAAAVAACVAPLAIGTQTFGSIIRPAAFCGIVGFKPSYGVLPLSGVHPLSPTLDHAGLLARCVEDIAFVFAELAGRPAVEPDQISLADAGLSLNVERPRIRIVRTPVWRRLEREQQQAVESAAEAFRSAGAIVETSELPAEFDGGWELANTIIAAEATLNLGGTVAAHPDLASAHLKELVETGANLPAQAYAQALHGRRRLRSLFAEWTGGADVILTAPALGAAPLAEQGTGDAAACTLWTLLGAPAITVPWTRNSAGLPLGIQLVGAPRQDASLLQLAQWCELHRS